MIHVRDDGYVTKVLGQIHITDCRSVTIHSRKRAEPWERPELVEKFAGVKAKKKCCRSKPRCKRCPLVLHKVHKAELSGIRGKDLEKVFKRARKA